MYRIVLKSQAYKQLLKLPKNDQKKIANTIDELAASPFIGKKLEGELSGLYTLRVWPYRIIYTVNKKIVTITVVAIGHRQGIYKKIR
ncbi:type II toxin-antitoxin system RelE/ParE family toxin [Patescibacteria group bacterium]|nr:type II toxin-antitoxin system RelE/ParE family toxin [Patescibacteria group bacterium]